MSKELDAVLDGLESQHAQLPDAKMRQQSEPRETLSIAEEPIEEQIEEVIEELEEEHIEEVIEEAIEESPPGFMGYEDWIAAGKDPKKYKGEDAYSAEYDRIQKSKDDISDLKDSMKDVVAGMDSWKAEQRDKIRTDLMSELTEAKDSGDVDAALDIQEKINAIPQDVVKQEPKQHPVIGGFIDKNPLIDQNSDRYNEDFYTDMSAFHTNIVKDLAPNSDGSGLTDRQIERSLQMAYDKAKQMNPELFKSPRKAREQRTPMTKKRAAPTTEDPQSQVRNIKVDRSNARDTNPATEMYEAIKKTSGQAAADKFAKNIQG